MQDHTIRFFPLGNADTTLISLSNNKHILWDYANVRSKDDKNDKRCKLPAELDKVVDGHYDVVTFTHADKDHIQGFSEYFELWHAEKYQGVGRKRIKELWVPATVLLDTQAEDEAKVLKAEARYRLKEKKGILVFSRPEKMKRWCEEQDDISYDEVKHLFMDAGKIVPSISLAKDGVEFFVHAPFSSDSKELDRNGSCIVVQAQFNDYCSTKLILGADSTWELWEDIISVTQHFKEHVDRLEWDFFHVSHHCSYLSLSDEKGSDKTVPTKNIKWLYETQGSEASRFISSSKPIPTRGSEADEDKNPPHRQAANYYRDVAKSKSGEFLVTMEHPKESDPKEIVVRINTQTCAKVEKVAVSSATYVGTNSSPRAGS